MKERRKLTDRRVKPPKQGLPAYYDRLASERRQYPNSPENNRAAESTRVDNLPGMTVKFVKEIPGS